MWSVAGRESLPRLGTLRTSWTHLELCVQSSSIGSVDWEWFQEEKSQLPSWNCSFFITVVGGCGIAATLIDESSPTGSGRSVRSTAPRFVGGPLAECYVIKLSDHPLPSKRSGTGAIQGLLFFSASSWNFAINTLSFPLPFSTSQSFFFLGWPARRETFYFVPPPPAALPLQMLDSFSNG